MIIKKANKAKFLLLTAAYVAYIGRRRRYWVHPLNTQRAQFGEYKILCLQLEMYPEKYFTYFRMSQDKFNMLLEMIEPDIAPAMTNFRVPILPKLKLVLTLR